MFSSQDISRVKGVIFDCDGVLFDTREQNALFYNRILEALGLPPMTQEENEYSFAQTVAASLERLVPPELRSRIPEVQARLPYDDFLEKMSPEPGLVAFLETLRHLGVRRAINTNRAESMDVVLRHFQLKSFFHPVVTADLVSRPKPSPEGLRRIAREWDVPVSCLAYIGDSDLDRQAAQGADIPFWAYRNAKLEADLHVDSFEKLRQCFVSAWGRA